MAQPPVWQVRVWVLLAEPVEVRALPVAQRADRHLEYRPEQGAVWQTAAARQSVQLGQAVAAQRGLRSAFAAGVASVQAWRWADCPPAEEAKVAAIPSVPEFPEYQYSHCLDPTCPFLLLPEDLTDDEHPRKQQYRDCTCNN